MYWIYCIRPTLQRASSCNCVQYVCVCGHMSHRVFLWMCVIMSGCVFVSVCIYGCIELWYVCVFMFAHVCACVCVRVGVGVGVCARLCLCCVPTCLHACMHVLCVYVGSENRVYPKSNGLSSFSLLNGHVGGYPIFRHTNVWVCMCAHAESSSRFQDCRVPVLRVFGLGKTTRHSQIQRLKPIL